MALKPMTANNTQNTRSTALGVFGMSLPRETASSLTSYGVGSCGIVTGLLDQAHALTIVLGVLVLAMIARRIAVLRHLRDERHQHAQG